jgi:GntR family transcriptional regulator
MDQIRFHVAGGLLSPGDELPSPRALTARLGINPMTVSKAFRLLEEEGVVERRPGLTLVVKPVRPAAARHNRLEQLRAVLGPSVTRIRQLGVDDSDAVEVLRELLAESEDGEHDGEG